MMAVPEHLEAQLGPIDSGWSRNAGGENMPFQVVRFRDVPFENCDTYTTLGLSNFALSSPSSGKEIRLELLMLSRPDSQQGIPGLLQQASLESISTGTACLRGDVVGPRTRLWPHSSMSALYVTAPAYFPDAFASCRTRTLGDIIFAWLVPISANEASLAAALGWSAFEDRLEAQDPDLLDPLRPDIS